VGDEIRINRFLAAAGLGSRRKVEELVLEGRVSVNGQTITDLACKVDTERDRVRVGGRVVQLPRRVVYVILHKPPGVLTTAHDPEGRQTVFDLLEGAPSPLFSVGRLDRMSEGLLLLTNDGPLAYRLAHPRYRIPRIYRLQVAGEMPEELIARFRRGTSIGGQTTRPDEVKVIHRSRKGTFLEVVLVEGKNREIRRICQDLGLKVDRLLRIEYGPLSLRGLPSGAWRHLGEREVDSLRKAVRLGVS